MTARRDFLRQVLPMGALGAVALNTDWLGRVVEAGAAVADRSAADVAADEGYWRDIQQAFTLDRTIINLNNGYTCPSPRVVHEALKRYLDVSNQAPVHFMWNTARAERRAGAAQARARGRLRHGGARDHAQRQRGAADRAARHRPAARRSRRDDEPGLRADARHLGSARPPRQDRGDEDLVPGADDEHRRADADGSPRRSRRRPR